MSVLETIKAKRDEIYAVARKHKAERLWVFGSCARREETPQSDVDFLVKFHADASLKNLMGLEREVSAMLGRPVDVVENKAVRRDPRFAWQVCQEAVPV